MHEAALDRNNTSLAAGSSFVLARREQSSTFCTTGGPGGSTLVDSLYFRSGGPDPVAHFNAFRHIDHDG
jgi:hypothetical protein